MTIPSARAARMRRACEHFLDREGLDLSWLDTLTEAAAESAVRLARDLAPNEIDAVCRLTVERIEREAEVRRQKEEHAAKLETARLQYLRRRGADYRLLADEWAPAKRRA